MEHRSHSLGRIAADVWRYLFGTHHALHCSQSTSEELTEHLLASAAVPSMPSGRSPGVALSGWWKKLSQNERASCYKDARQRVGVRGFEPPAPASRTQCSTRLSYTPTEHKISVPAVNNSAACLPSTSHA